MARGSPPSSTLSVMGRALRHRNFRLFFVGQSVSLTGTWMTRVATSWLIYRLTDSALLLGLVGFAGQIPTFLVAPLAGVLVDRWNRHRVLVVTQIAAMVQSALLATLALTGVIDVWWVLALSIVQGVINAFDTPARQAFVLEMVEDPEDLPNAIAINSSTINAARLVGPSIAGLLIAAVGEGWCFAVDAVSYVAVVASLLAMRLRPAAPRAAVTRVMRELADGFCYVASSEPIRAILVLLAITSFTGVPYMVLMPVFASEVLHGGPNTLGLLTAATGIGAVAGALWLAARRSVLGLGSTLVTAGLVFGVGLIAFSFSSTLWLSIPLLVLASGGMMIQMAASNTLIQTLVDEDKRGRVMSFYTMAFFGTLPLGSLAAGALAESAGAPATVRYGGMLTIGAVLLFAWSAPRLRELARPIDVERGVLPEVAGLRHGADPENRD